jgi:hypothetical protein
MKGNNSDNLLFDNSNNLIYTHVLIVFVFALFIYFSISNSINVYFILVSAAVLFLYIGGLTLEVNRIYACKDKLVLDKLLFVHRRKLLPLVNIKLVKLRPSNIAMVSNRIRVLMHDDSKIDFYFSCSDQKLYDMILTFSELGLKAEEESPFGF